MWVLGTAVDNDDSIYWWDMTSIIQQEDHWQWALFPRFPFSTFACYTFISSGYSRHHVLCFQKLPLRRISVMPGIN